jgi:hypothetical protein
MQTLPKEYLNGGGQRGGETPWLGGAPGTRVNFRTLQNHLESLEHFFRAVTLGFLSLKVLECSKRSEYFLSPVTQVSGPGKRG